MTGTAYLMGARRGSANLAAVRGPRLLQSCGTVIYSADEHSP